MFSEVVYALSCPVLGVVFVGTVVFVEAELFGNVVDSRVNIVFQVSVACVLCVVIRLLGYVLVALGWYVVWELSGGIAFSDETEVVAEAVDS